MQIFPTRLKASLIHLACSAAVAGAAMAIIFWVWHPGALAELQGVSRLVLILIGVDMTLGPLMTLIIFNPHKAARLIRLDLTVIALLQISALLYGLTTIYLARPVYLVFNIDRITVVAASEVNRESLALAQRNGQPGMSLGTPRLVSARLPDDPKAREEMMMSSLGGGPDLPQLPQWFVPYSDESEAIVTKLRPLAELRKSNERDEQWWHRWQKRLPQPPDSIGYLPVVANASDGAALIDRSTGKLLRIDPLTPLWAKRE